MVSVDSSIIPAPTRLEGKYIGMVVCWILGFGSLVSWNSMLTIGDYYYELFPKYHPSRVLTLVYQPFALATMAILVYNEARIDTSRIHSFFLKHIRAPTVGFGHVTSWRFWKLHWYMCYRCCFWSC